MDIHSIALNETLLENELVILNNNEKTLLFKKRECAHRNDRIAAAFHAVPVEWHL